MSSSFNAAMRQALDHVRAQDPAAATETIRRALAGQTASAAPANDRDPPARHPQGPSADHLKTIEHDAHEPMRRAYTAKPKETGGRPDGFAGANAAKASRARRPLKETVDGLAASAKLRAAFSGLPGAARRTEPDLPDGAAFHARSFDCPAGTRTYRLYVPAALSGRAAGLVVMLHGCRQTPEDFALGTQMNQLAEEYGLVIAYPEQTSRSNASSCWNWFNPGDQARDAGEPAVIAGITREVAAEFGVDRAHTFVAGLSAGGAMAAVMGETYSDLFAAIGVHSGLAFGSASDVASAFSAMQGKAPGRSGGKPRTASANPVRTIVFHGSRDTTVSPVNAAHIVSAATGADYAAKEETQHAVNGRSASCSRVRDANGKVRIESWLVDGAGHAWSGGNPAGSFTDGRGPDASREMVRFFLEA
ncbi:extracellular catalytic domain type 1 short-chain-length polyhydroxyalkanoate depolymerase [Pararhizobium mangrovi]|uniref:PHB depolymerase family esterase n=1 Tax=Pararhizobium mangrovi TaxID=2590452 RepID=A0A506UHJ2_9HYPH|nr:PHB depolymerase family esterase [Pararhizobium mangrovi]TPW32784.1 PHB depolymerase family esterase [Pararhizobium mangrovi]